MAGSAHKTKQTTKKRANEKTVTDRKGILPQSKQKGSGSCWEVTAASRGGLRRLKQKGRSKPHVLRSHAPQLSLTQSRNVWTLTRTSELHSTPNWSLLCQQ